MRTSMNAATMTASGRSVEKRGRIIAAKTKAGTKNQIPIFRMFRLSINMQNAAFISAKIGFAAENVKRAVLKGIGGKN
jgi:hypothetical protein